MSDYYLYNCETEQIEKFTVPEEILIMASLNRRTIFNTAKWIKRWKLSL